MTMSTNNSSKIAHQTHHLKRKRVDDDDDDDDDEEEEKMIMDKTPAVQSGAATYSTSSSSSSSATQSPTTTISNPPPLPPLQDIPETVEVLYKMMHAGGCPRCGSTLHCRRTYITKDFKNYYTCDACQNDFRLPKNKPPSSTIITATTTTKETTAQHKDDRVGGSVKRKYNDDNSDNNNKVDTTFQSKLHLQTLVNYAQSEIIKHDMQNDYVKFQRQVKRIVTQIHEKRKRVLKCLSVSVDDKGGGDGNKKVRRGSASSTSPFATTKKPKERVVINEDANNEESEKNDVAAEKDPFQESIRLLKQETRKLEQVMNNLLDLHQHGSIGDDGGIPQQSLSQLFSSLGEPVGGSTTRLQKDGVVVELNTPSSSTSHNIDVVNEYPSSVSLLKSLFHSARNDGETAQYRLASRVLQEDGEEIEIYEKDVDA